MSTNREQDGPSGRAVNVPCRFDRRRLAVASLGVDDRTIIRAYKNPNRVREATRRRLVAAALELGLPPPPSESTSGRSSS